MIIVPSNGSYRYDNPISRYQQNLDNNASSLGISSCNDGSCLDKRDNLPGEVVYTDLRGGGENRWEERPVCVVVRVDRTNVPYEQLP